MFYDRAKLEVRAGNGGDGSASFRREKFAPKGGPDGGDGGRGGSVYLRVDPSMNTLLAFHYKQHFKAQHGGSGRSNQRHGKAALRPGRAARLGCRHAVGDDDQATQRTELQGLESRPAQLMSPTSE